jgi:hypothetical protein
MPWGPADRALFLRLTFYRVAAHLAHVVVGFDILAQDFIFTVIS